MQVLSILLLLRGGVSAAPPAWKGDLLNCFKGSELSPAFQTSLFGSRLQSDRKVGLAMKSEHDTQSFFEPKMLLALSLAFAVLFGWQHYLKTKYPGYGAGDQSIVDNPEDNIVGKSDSFPQNDKSELKKRYFVEKQVENSAEKSVEFAFEDDRARFSVSSFGFAVQNFVDLEVLDRTGESMAFFGPSGRLFWFELDQKPIAFDLKQNGPNSFQGCALECRAKVSLDFDSEMHRFYITADLDGTLSSSEFSVRIQDEIEKMGEKTWFFPSSDVNDLVIYQNGSTERQLMGDSAEVVESAGSEFLGFGNQYFTTAFVNSSEFVPRVSIAFEPSRSGFLADVIYPSLQTDVDRKISGTIYVGPKSIERLESLHPSMTELMDFGMFSVIGFPLLRLMRWFYSLTGNWGWAIILLTLVVRIAVLPAVLYSQKSLKKFQELKPKMDLIKEKYKNDQAKQQQEIMLLMKETGANPISGCLPMLLQFPIFIALFQVLRNSIELYQAPFVFWISDLSLMDPFFILPVLQGVVTFFHVKMTPAQVDPQMQKVMLFMPLAFTVFMVTLPSGLVLYTFTSTLFAVIQQYFLIHKGGKTV